MKKVVLLGDSIRLLGYGKAVEKALADEYCVWQPADNCRFAKFTLREVSDWQKQLADADIIHWNNGLWDIHRIVDGEVFTPMEQYVEEMVRLAKKLQQYAPTVIFATTTPVREGRTDFLNTDVIAYNEALLPRLKAMGIIINDLYGLIKDNKDCCICEDLVHLSETGIQQCAKQVETVIRQYAHQM